MIVEQRKHSWIPFLGVLPVTEIGIHHLGLDPRFKWKAFVFDWLDFGWVFVAWAKELKEQE